LGTSDVTLMVTSILANIMAIGHFPTPAGAHVGAAVETKQDGEDQEKRQGFRVHALSGAQGVRGVVAAVSAAMVIAGSFAAEDSGPYNFTATRERS
jgi:hypothetical protein